MKNKLLVLTLGFVFIVYSGFSNKNPPQKIENGIYYGRSGLFLKKHVFIQVNDSVAELECYVYWQGQWMNFVRSNEVHHNRIKLDFENGNYSNPPVFLKNKGGKKKVRITKTFLGKVRVKVEQVNEFDSATNRIRNSALLFSTEEIKYTNSQDSISFYNLPNKLEMNHKDFRDQYFLILKN
jgi:hypothetical protein